MRNVVAYGKIKRAGDHVELKINGRIAFSGQLADMILDGRPECKVVVSVREDHEPKTNEQLKYYWGVVVPYCQLGFNALGWRIDKERTDYELRIRFHKERIVNTETGEAKYYPASLSKCSKEDLGEFIDSAKQFAIEELGVTVPEATTQTTTV